MSNLKDLITRRVDQPADELNFDRHRIVGWAYSQAVLAGVWSFEEGSLRLAGLDGLRRAYCQAAVIRPGNGRPMPLNQVR